MSFNNSATLDDTLAELDAWLAARKASHRFSIGQIPFDALEGWSFENTTGNLVHNSGKFFRIEGIWVETNYGYKGCWSQPIINQPEIGILGFLMKVIDGMPWFLMQAKMEPGNLGLVQLAPTLQATHSNFTRVHKGKSPPYLDYFTCPQNSKIIIDILQSEQGARFLRKRNRNIIIQVYEDIPVLEDYFWVSLEQLRTMIRRDNAVNMDARTVLSCLALGQPASGRISNDGISESDSEMDTFRKDIILSANGISNTMFSIEEIISWFTRLKFSYFLNIDRIPLKYVHDWKRDSFSLHHKDNKYFSIIAVKVEADNREVSSWCQPILKPREDGILAFILKRINGVLHLLVQGKVEPGNFDVVEMAPSVQCLTGSYRDVPVQDRPPYLDYVLNAHPSQVIHSSMQSEEGGRFFHEQNQNIVLMADESFPVDVPENYIWMTIGQLKDFIKFNNFVNVQARCLLACIII